MKNKVLIFLIIIIFSVGIFVIKEAKAGAGDNVYGWAWSENIGWISFNSTNCDVNGNGIYEGVAEGASTECPSSGTAYSYRVDIDPATGLFSGYAWSENIGWISFEQADLASSPDGFNRAQLDLDGITCGAVGQVCGWARAYRAIVPGGQTLGGWDGWIKLRDASWANGVSLNSAPAPSEFEGWAWGDVVVGWISFNCSNRGVCSAATGEGGPSDYKVMTSVVINLAPSAIDLYDDDIGYCIPIILPLSSDGEGGSRSSPPIRLNWTFSDDKDSQNDAYQVQIIEEGGDFTSPLIDSCLPSPGTCSSGSNSNQYTPPFSFGTKYYWRLKVWDSDGADSGWINAPAPFTTDAHRWPNTDFIPDPSAGVEVTFIDNSKCYTSAGGEYDCQTGTTPPIGYRWDFDYPPFNDPPDDTTKGTTTYTYSIQGDYIVRLEVTDDIGMCPYEYPLTTSLPLPKWREIAPF